MKILVTRPEPGASRTMAALEAKGLGGVAAPLFTIAQASTPRPSGRFAALIVTSLNGAAELTPALADLPADLPVFAVGDRTAEAMMANGFSNVTSASGDQKALTRLVFARLKPRYRVLLATGEDHKEALPEAFAAAGHEIALWVRYKAEAVEELPRASKDAIAAGEIDAVLHYSRRAAETFLALAGREGLAEAASRLRHIALSEDVAEPLRAAGAQNVAVAAQPDEEHLLASLAGPADAADAAGGAGFARPAGAEAATPDALAPRVVKPSRRAQGALAPAEVVAAAPEAAPSGVAEPAASPAEEQTGPAVAGGPAAWQAGVAPERDAAGNGADVPTPERKGPGWGAVALVALLAGLAGGVAGAVLPRFVGGAPDGALEQRLARLEAPRPAAETQAQAAQVQAALQNVAAPLRQQIEALDRRVSELSARPPAQGSAGAGADPALKAEVEELRRQASEAQRAAQALAPRLGEIEAASRRAAAPSASSAGAARLVVAERLGRAIEDGRPFQQEVAALGAMGAPPEALAALSQAAAGGAPTMRALAVEFRKVRPALVAEPASGDAPWYERLLRLTDGLVRVRSTGAAEGTTPPALAARIDQALQRGDAAAAEAAFQFLPEPARRAGEGFAAPLRRRAALDRAVKTISDDAVRALSGQI
jgi:uroporphyrinogen-III synthase